MGIELPCALAIGGLDPGGGAGVVADLRAIAFAGAFGAAVVAVSTVQSSAPDGELRGKGVLLPAWLTLRRHSVLSRHAPRPYSER